MTKCETFEKFNTLINLRYTSTSTISTYINCFWKFANSNPKLLGHSIATQLIDQGEQQLKVQMFLGHKSPESTIKYYHVAPNALNNINLPVYL